MAKLSSTFTIFLCVLMVGCHHQVKTSSHKAVDGNEKTGVTDSTPTTDQNVQDPFGIPYLHPTPISQFVRRIFQDKSGNLWFGTNGDGVIRYNGDSLEYFGVKDGFGGYAVRAIVEDKKGNVWFGTSGGLTRYDGESFTNFNEKDGLVHRDVWCVTIDNDGLIWVGTFQGISIFNGKSFSPFYLPESQPDSTRGVTSANIVHCILEDSKGHMWFGTSGGAYKHHGKALSLLSEEDGLCNEVVNDILEDRTGNMWFATHHGGVSRYNGTSFENFTCSGAIKGEEVWSLCEDALGNIWFPAEGFGVYAFNPQAEKMGNNGFTRYGKNKGLASEAIQSIYEDRQKRLWLGGYMGLFRCEAGSFYPVNENGPWGE